MTKKLIRAEHTARAAITAGPQDSGSIRFGMIPSGGFAAGSSASCAGGSDERLILYNEKSLYQDRKIKKAAVEYGERARAGYGIWGSMGINRRRAGDQ